MRPYFTLAALACSLGALAIATPADARINKRQNHQQQRIAGGISSGSLTAREAARLERQQAGIARYEARSRADGPGLTRVERARIEAMQDRASVSIRRQKRDGQSR
jgi:hypothetical protein